MPNIIKPIINLPKDIGEAVLKPTAGEIGKAIEEGVTTVITGPNQTPVKNPAPDPQKKVEDERRRQNILRYFESLKANAQNYKQQQDYMTQQKKQDEVAQEQKVKQFEIQKKQKQQSVDVFRSQRKAEIKVKGG